MNDPQISAPADDDAVPCADPAADALFAGSLRRIEWLIPVLAFSVALVLVFFRGWKLALGFAAGCAVAYLNFRWLKSTVEAVAAAVTGDDTEPRSRPSVVLRFLARFFLIAAGAYAILKSSPAAFYGFLGGLFVPVLAILVEAAFVAYSAIRPSR